MKKIHHVLLETIHQNLSNIFIEGLQTDKVVQASLKANPKYGSRDRKFIAKASYDMVRWWRTFHLDYVDFEKPTSQQISQALYYYLVKNELPIPSWDKFEGLSQELPAGETSFAQTASIPDWLDTLGRENIENWEAKMTAMNQEADVVLRCNSKKSTPEDLIAALAKEDVQITQIEGNSFFVNERRRVTHTQAYQKGLFEIQDYGSQKIAPFLEVKSGDFVIDACSGAGGKTLHLADLMRNKGKIVSMDIYEGKLKELTRRSRRNGYKIITTNVIKDAETISQYDQKANRVLLDVPCSGLGVLKRNPGTKWFLQPDFIAEIQQTQKDILQSYSSMTKVGGTLVYATCSILPDENENQVQAFLESNKNFELIEAHTLSPETHHSDGYYMAKLIRKS